LSICRDPEIQKDFVNGLYDHSEFIQAASNSLNDDGILLIQVGQAPLAKDPPEQHSKFKNRLDLTRTLVSYGFEHIQDYEEVCQS
jgi:spermidine synthase